MNGWMGQIIRVNLTDNVITKEPINYEHAKQYIGCRGLGTRMWIDECDPQVDPLGPDNKLIFITGALTGTLAVCSGRYEVVCKGPLTGTIAASNSGGYFGPELKYAGYDGIIVEGKSEKPVYLWINDDEVELRDAGHLWGKDTYDTTDTILEETNKKARVNCIGPAGENQVLIAAIMNDYARAAGRTGVGAVMGSKNLKAIAVRGTGSVKIADPKGFKEVMDNVNNILRENPSTGTDGGLHVYGSNVTYSFLDDAGVLPIRNFRDTGTDIHAEALDGETQTSKWLVRSKGCNACPIRCARITRSEGKFETYGEGPELETIWSFGSNCGHDDMAAVMLAGRLCNLLGIDTISMGATIACAMELYENGYINKDQTDMDVSFGNVDSMIELIKRTAYKQGFGRYLAEGSYRMADKFGHPELSMTVKKQELSAYDPRGLQAMGLNYAVANRGACHVRGFMPALEIYGLPEVVDRFATEGKAAYTIASHDSAAAVDATGTCLFVTFGISVAELAMEMTAVTGVQYSTEDFMKAGERIWNLERLINLKMGFTRADDTLPKRLLTEPVIDGPSKGHVNRLSEMLDDYYNLRKWDENGVPTKMLRDSLDLNEINHL